MKRYLKVNAGKNLPCIILFIYILFSFKMDQNIFVVDDLWNNKVYYLMKLIAVISMVGGYAFFSRIIQKMRSGDEFAKSFLKNFCLYFGIMMILLVLTWPGVWRSDEAYLLTTDLRLEFNRWHHWLTDAFYDVALCIIGFPTGIIIVQDVIISLMFAYVVTKTRQIFRKHWNWIVYIPYFFPSVLDGNLYPLRASVITHMEIFFVVYILYQMYEKKNIKWYMYVLWSVFIAVLATWRSEGVYYIILAPILVFILLNKKINIRKFICMWLAAISLVVGINYVQNNQNYSVTYSCSMLTGHLQAFVEQGNLSEEEMNIINAVFPEEWGHNYSQGFTLLLVNQSELNDPDFESKVSELKKLYFKQIVKHPWIYFKDCWKQFVKSSLSIHSINTTCAQTVHAFDEGYGATCGTLMTNPYNNYLLYMPWSKDVRAKTISILECRSFENYTEANILNLVFYNVLPSVILLLICGVYGIIKRRKEFFFISGFLLIRTVIVFGAAPAEYFMYYMPTVLAGYVMLIILLLWNASKKEK